MNGKSQSPADRNYECPKQKLDPAKAGASLINSPKEPASYGMDGSAEHKFY